MKKLLFMLTTVTMLLVCGALHAETLVVSKIMTSQTVHVDDFNAIVASADIDVVYTQNAQTSVEIYAPENVLPYVAVAVNKKTLTMGFTKNRPKMKGKCKVELRISAPMVTSFKCTDGSKLTVNGALKSKEDVTVATIGTGNVKIGAVDCTLFVIESNGSGDIDVKKASCDRLQAQTTGSANIEIGKLTCKTVTATTIGSGNIKLSGSCRSAEFEGKGKGSIKADSLKANSVKANAYGSCKIACYADDSLKADTAGKGEVVYKGKPTELSSSNKNGVHSK